MGGLVGLDKPNNHGVPYSLTEDFTSVYRMHSLLPDTLTLRNINANPGPNKSPAILEEYAVFLFLSLSLYVLINSTIWTIIIICNNCGCLFFFK